MKIPPEIVLRGVEITPYMEKIISNGIAKLEKVSNRIVSTHIAIELAQRRHQTGEPLPNAHRNQAT